MKLFKCFRRFAASLPIIGPHVGLEVELLLAGKKPVAVFAFPTTPHSDAEIEYREIIMRQTQCLDRAAQRGQLQTCAGTVQAHDYDSGSETMFVFYCQPKFAAEMIRLSRHCLRKDNSYLSPSEVGGILGYLPADTWLFQKGGYASLGPFISDLARKSHDYRVRCRLENTLQYDRE